ncbi:restriction endonuclease subunit S [Vannielia litorea]|uniref:restriction endonuclease subunit S n=1 Tax=Vannielia litorea TaxID=1217970 RepID=UPI001C959659|nr:restriction endonuclease subunit S [Vannielia litorea]MBY6152944.1 restriction endonuclease subunit S [Vannielia litorea]
MSKSGFPEGPIGSLIVDQVGGGTPSRQNPVYWNGPIPWASVKDFEDGQLELASTEETISRQGLNNSATNLIPASTPIVCTRMAVGRAAVALMEVAINQDLKALFPAKDVSTRYLLRLADFAKPLAEAVSVGSTVKGIKIADYLNIEVPLAPSTQQSKIAEVLDTLDAAIRGTEAVVAKLKAMKQGLLHDLLTRGIDANGDLRPPQPEAPHLYKQTPLGWLPKEWDALPLGDYTQHDITYGIVQAGPHIEGGIPYVRTGDMSGDELVRDTMLCTSERIARSYRRSEVRAGELVIAIRATLGKVLPVPENLDGANLTQGTARIAPKGSVNATCLKWAIRHRRGQDAIMKEVKGSTFMEISLGALRIVPIGMPKSRDEQDEIARRLSAQDEAILREQKLLDKLRLQKSGLMDDLLTGRTPVTALL